MTTQKMPAGWKFIIDLPPRRDEKTVVEKNWEPNLDEGVTFEGQHFAFPDGLVAGAAVQWLEESLLSVRLSLRGTLKGECARCLAEASLAISDDLMYLYYSRGVVPGKNTQLPSDEGYLPVETDELGRTLNLADQVWESLLVLLPLKLLCREDCAGLCQYCGADLNEGPCACKPQEGNFRFGSLRSFVLEDEN